MNTRCIEKFNKIIKTPVWIIPTIIILLLIIFLSYAYVRRTQKTENNRPAETGVPQVVMFHNGQGPMCVQAVEFFEEYNYPFEQHLTWEENFQEELENYKAKSPQESEGVSKTYGYYPLIFIDGRAFSGFTDEIRQEIINIFGNER